jgi:hypothetical protein
MQQIAGDYPQFTDFYCFSRAVSATFASKSNAMQVILINGNPDSEKSAFDRYLEDFKNKLSAAGHSTRILTLREMNLGFCRGCFQCWHTTPGICSIKDDIVPIHKAVIHAELVIWASPLGKSYVSSLLKKVQERMIPLLHPYVEIVNGEIHHRGRYGNYPWHGVIVEKESDSTREELVIVQQIQDRYALNFRSKLIFFLTTDMSVSEAVHKTILSIRAETVNTMDPERTGGHALAFYTSSLN